METESCIRNCKSTKKLFSTALVLSSIILFFQLLSSANNEVNVNSYLYILVTTIYLDDSKAMD